MITSSGYDKFITHSPDNDNMSNENENQQWQAELKL